MINIRGRVIGMLLIAFGAAQVFTCVTIWGFLGGLAACGFGAMLVALEDNAAD